MGASYRQRLPFGAVGLAYDRAIGTAGGLGGTTDNQLISGYVEVSRLSLRAAHPAAASLGDRREGRMIERIDVKSFTMALQATYRVTPWSSLIGGYQFFLGSARTAPR